MYTHTRTAGDDGAFFGVTVNHDGPGIWGFVRVYETTTSWGIGITASGKTLKFRDSGMGETDLCTRSRNTHWQGARSDVPTW